MKLFLDDIRQSPDDTWTIARSYDTAVSIVESHGFPDIVSFDHDLGDDEKTGATFARFLVDLDLDKGVMPGRAPSEPLAVMPAGFAYMVHSANPVGRDNIVGLLDRYMRWKAELDLENSQKMPI